MRVELPTNAAKGDVVTLQLGSSVYATKSLGASQLSDGYVDFLVTAGTLGADGTKVFTAFLADSVENVGASSQAFQLTLDTIATAPTINPVAANNVINIGDETSIISGTTEAGSSVSVAFGSLTKAATVVGTKWSYQLTTADIAAMGQGAETISVRQTDAAGNVSSLAQKTISVDTVAPLTFTVTQDAGGLTFAGTSSGAIAISFENGVATFTQGTATASTTITASDLQALTLTFAEAINTAVTLDLTGSGVSGEFVLQTEFLDELTLTGELGNISVVRLQVTDSDIDDQELVSFKIDTADVTG